MVAVRMMQVTLDQIIDVIAMRDGGMAAVRAVHVLGIVPAALVARRAGVRIFGGDGDRVIFNVIALSVMKMSVVQVIDVSVMLDRHMSAIGAVLVSMSFVHFCRRHRRSP
jgi:hypothetical protein